MNTLVMIPAFGCDARLYQPVAAKLATSTLVQTIIPTADRFEGMVDEVLAKAPANFVILGTSMGGRLALETALAAPSRVAGLVVIGAGAGAVADVAAGLRRSQRIRGGERDQVISEMAAIISHLPGPGGPVTREAFIAMASGMDIDNLARQSDALAHREDRWPRLGEVACPVLCIWGVHDQFSPAADGLRLSSAVQHGRYAEIADCGHFPSLEYPEETAAILDHWLRDSSLT